MKFLNLIYQIVYFFLILIKKFQLSLKHNFITLKKTTNQPVSYPHKKKNSFPSYFLFFFFNIFKIFQNLKYLQFSQSIPKTKLTFKSTQISPQYFYKDRSSTLFHPLRSFISSRDMNNLLHCRIFSKYSKRIYPFINFLAQFFKTKSIHPVKFHHNPSSPRFFSLCSREILNCLPLTFSKFQSLKSLLNLSLNNLL